MRKAQGRFGLDRRRWFAAIALSSMSLVAAACSSSTSGGAASASAAGGKASTVNVTLQEFAVIPDVASVPAGTVTFVAKNIGPDDVHEMVVIKTDLAPDALPVGADGVVDEEGAGIEPIGEVEDVEVNGSKQVALVLEPGKYVVICNILQTEPDGSLESHYKVGMRTGFEVTAP